MAGFLNAVLDPDPSKRPDVNTLYFHSFLNDQYSPFDQVVGIPEPVKKNSINLIPSLDQFMENDSDYES